MSEIGCKFVICSDSTVSMVKDLSKLTNNINVIHVQEKTGLNRFLLSQNGSEFRCIYTDDGSVESFLVPVNLDVDNEVAIITFTSGTTGNRQNPILTGLTYCKGSLIKTSLKFRLVLTPPPSLPPLSHQIGYFTYILISSVTIVPTPLPIPVQV